MAQRISRAKQSIKASSVPFSMPNEAERAERLDSVLHVLYLIFSEGYTGSIGADLHRTDLSNEAIRLSRVMHGLLPGDGEVAGLLALMLLTDALNRAIAAAMVKGPHAGLELFKALDTDARLSGRYRYAAKSGIRSAWTCQTPSKTRAKRSRGYPPNPRKSFSFW